MKNTMKNFAKRIYEKSKEMFYVGAQQVLIIFSKRARLENKKRWDDYYAHLAEINRIFDEAERELKRTSDTKVDVKINW